MPIDAESVRIGVLTAQREPVVAHRTGEAVLNALMDRYASGDDTAFQELYAHLGPRVSRFLLHLTGSPAVAEELTQETFLRMHRARGSFSRGGAGLPWVYTVGRNVFSDHERKRKVHSVVVLDDGLAQAQPDAVARQPDRILDSRRTLHCVRGALARMPVSQREAFVLLRFEGLSVSDAAEVLGSTEASVKSRAFRAYQAIRLVVQGSNAEGEE